MNKINFNDLPKYVATKLNDEYNSLGYGRADLFNFYFRYNNGEYNKTIKEWYNYFCSIHCVSSFNDPKVAEFFVPYIFGEKE